jgi:hypothetical protein
VNREREKEKKKNGRRQGKRGEAWKRKEKI